MLQWNPASVNLSVITLGEIERGIVKLRKVDPERATRLDLWLRELRRDNAGRNLAVTEDVVLSWGRIPAGRTRGSADTLSALPAEYPGWMLERQAAGRRPAPFAPKK
ncbi:hypothetical protein [Mesorhizobium sp.]|uniref:hypothetical protein n=1 Tax=Mesorhizobium sp. TaxID=1871066 RepID=UPI0025C64A92|nr:hypothetical protein [Mesorhizobium sp.]